MAHITELVVDNKIVRASKVLERRVAVIKAVALVLLVAAIGGVAVGFVVLNLIGTIALSYLITISLAVGAYSISYFLCKPNASVKQADIAVYLILGGLTTTALVAQLLMGSATAIPGASIFIVILAAIGGLNFLALLGVGLIAVGLLLSVYLLEKVLLVYTPPLEASQYPFLNFAIWLILIVASLICVGIFLKRIRIANDSLEEQTERLYQLLVTFNTSNEIGVVISHELTNVSIELNNNSREQDEVSKEHVAALSEVAIGLEELSKTAGHIALGASQVANSANEAVDMAEQVTKASNLAKNTSNDGARAVEEAVASVSRVSHRIELLGQKLLNLTEQTRKVTYIIDIIEEIANETHLLALNASIEAVGAGEGFSNSLNNVRGDRFGVIAAEVKNLADRSRTSTEEVREFITQMQLAVTAAVLVAEEGKKEITTALRLSLIAGQVIDRLSDVIVQSATQASQILVAVERVNNLCDEIRTATTEQSSANQQIVTTMQAVATSSKQSAENFTQLSHTVGQFKARFDELSQVLTSATDVMPVQLSSKIN